MTGRVLTEEEIQKSENEAIMFPHDDWTSHAILDLIATIRDRDKTIAELLSEQKEYTESVIYWREIATQKQQQNTILREALELIVHHKNDYDDYASAVIFARGALAKVSADRGVL